MSDIQQSENAYYATQSRGYLDIYSILEGYSEATQLTI